MSDSEQMWKPCAVCAQQFKCADLQVVALQSLDLTLLRNLLLPPEVLLLSYGLHAYDGAILLYHTAHDCIE